MRALASKHGASSLPIEERMASKPSLARSDIGAFMRLRPLALWLLGATAGMAQLAPQASHVADEGQNVSAVSLIANPHRNLEPLFAVVTQKANAPYSQNRIEASAEALRKAGGFPKVDVNVVPDVSGLRVNFLLEPAYYLGVVSFPGAEKTFVYIRLLQVTTLSDEDPYDPARIPMAEDSLCEFLHRSGFFLARVQGEPSIDDAHEIVNINFVTELGKQAHVSGVRIEGPDPAESARLLHGMRSLRARLTGGLLKAGEPYSAERVSAAITLMKKTLAKEHRLATTIHENPPPYDAENNGVTVSFKVDPGPLVTVRTAGARLSAIPLLSEQQMKKLIPIYSEGTIDRDLVEEGQHNLIEYFQKKGFSDVNVRTDFQKKPDQIVVTYNIERGRKHKVDRILFHGNSAFSEKELLGQVALKKSHIWTHGSLSQKLLRQGAQNIEALYQDRGYEEVKVTPRPVDRELKVDVVFDIEEGPQTLVHDVRVEGNEHLTHQELTAPKGFQLQSGVPFSTRKMNDDRNRISANYLNRGYLNVEVKARAVRAADHQVNVSYAISEHQLVRVSRVVYLGQQHTQLTLLEKTAQVPVETPMRRAQLLAAESRLYDLQVFDWSSVGPRKPITDQSEETAVVKVHQAKRNEVTYGLGFEVSHRGGNVPTGTVALPGGGGTIGLNGYQIAPSQSTFASPRGLLEITRRNMRGLAETASASILLSRLDQKFLSTYTQPHFIGSQWQSLTSFSLERNSENPLFTAALGDASFQLERLLRRKSNTRLQLRYDYNKTDLSHILVPELVLPQDRSVRLSTLSGTLIRDTRDKPLDAHHGTFSTVDFGLTPTALGSSANFAKLFGQFAFYKPIHAVVFANSIRLGLAKQFANSFVPTSQLFFSGGGTSLRGFPIDEAGPQRLVPFCNVLQGQSGCVNVTVPVGGRQLFILNSEVRFPLPITKKLGGVVFYDGGNVNRAINFPNFIDNYTNTVGLGLRYATPIGPIRIDIGHNLNPVPGINPTQYYITVGQAF
jgi:outer membrane protein insertion porin family